MFHSALSLFSSSFLPARMSRHEKRAELCQEEITLAVLHSNWHGAAAEAPTKRPWLKGEDAGCNNVVIIVYKDCLISGLRINGLFILLALSLVVWWPLRCCAMWLQLYRHQRPWKVIGVCSSVLNFLCETRLWSHTFLSLWIKKFCPSRASAQHENSCATWS